MSSDHDSERVLILTPKGRDGEVAHRILSDRGFAATICVDVEQLCGEIRAGAGVVLVAAEALSRRAVEQMAETLREQPSWSELPLILFATPGPEGGVPNMEPLELRNYVTVVDRPIRVKTLISAITSALRARRRQYQLRDVMDALEGRVRERDRFLAILGHELRNPIGAILLAAQMRSPDGLLADEHARLIERQARHLTRLVDDLLDLSRVTSGKIVLKKRPIDLTAVVRHSFAILKESYEQHDLTAKLELPEQPVMVDGDPVRLEQIASNLLSNAMKYTPSGGTVVITVKAERRQAVLSVADDGIGIPAERLPHIFGLFAQAENAIGRSQGGMGIGLSLVRNLVDLHGGKVNASSDGPGKGSEFSVRFPLLTGVRVQSRDEELVDAQQPLPTRRRIVVVEDNPDVRTLLQLKLKRMGHEVVSVSDGERGAATISEVLPDLALVDIGLPGIDGYEVARRVRNTAKDRIFMVALSGFGQPEDKRRATEAGFDEHMTKPADMTDLERLIARIPGKASNE